MSDADAVTVPAVVDDVDDVPAGEAGGEQDGLVLPEPPDGEESPQYQTPSASMTTMVADSKR